MKAIYLVATLLVATLAITAVAENDDEIPTQCPVKDSKNTTVHLAHETDCTKFYMCQRGHRILRQCPFMDSKGNRLHFNPRLQVCDWPRRAGCISGEYNTTDVPKQPATTERTAITEEPTRATTTTEWTTTTEKPTRPTTTTEWTTTTEKPTRPTTTTEWTTTTERPTRATTTTEWTTTTEKPTRPTTTTEWTTTTEEPTRPTTTTERSTTTTEKSTSPEPTNPWTVSSSSVPDDEFESNTTNIPKPSHECPEFNDNRVINIPHESDCSKYYVCINGMKKEQTCAEGLEFNPILLVCDWPGVCKITSATTIRPTTPLPSPTPTPSTTPAPSKPNTCPKDSNETVNLPHECSCSKYYTCINGDQVLRHCPEGFLFDYIRRVCDWADKVHCAEDDKTTKPMTTTTRIPSTIGSTASSIVPGVQCPPGYNGKLPHESDCALYYVCKNGNANVKSCPDGFHFHPILQICDWPESVKCKNGKSSTTAVVTDDFEQPDSTTPSTPKSTTQITSETTSEFTPKHTPQTTPRSTPTSTPRSTPESTPRSTPESTPRSTPTSTPRSTPESTPRSTPTSTPRSTPESTTHSTPETTTGIPNCIGNCPHVDPHNYTVLLPNEDCTKFCKCSNGRPYVYDCPKGLHFDIVLNVCRYKADATCGKPLRVYAAQPTPVEEKGTFSYLKDLLYNRFV